jgi:hypothetical protein
MIKAIRGKLTFSNVLALAAVFLALGGTVYAASKINGKSIKKRSEPGNRLKNDSVTGKQVNESTLKLPAQVIGVTFPIHSVVTLNFGNISGSTCSSLPISAPGIKATDNVLVTPPPGWPDTFTVVGHPEPASNTVVFAACNTFTGGGSVDPDGAGGGPYKLLVIR